MMLLHSDPSVGSRRLPGLSWAFKGKGLGCCRPRLPGVNEILLLGARVSHPPKWSLQLNLAFLSTRQGTLTEAVVEEGLGFRV